MAVLQTIRDHFDVPVKIVSGTRCEKHNRKVGGAKKSQHLLGTAADIQVSGISPGEVARFAKSLMKGYGGVKAYATFTHVDTRANMWRG